MTTAEAFGCTGSMAVLLKGCPCYRIWCRLWRAPAFVHAGSFGNIAHMELFRRLDPLALRCADYVITEAGFGSDLGAEKFFNIKCRTSGLRPDAGVVVATLRPSLHGGGGIVKGNTAAARADGSEPGRARKGLPISNSILPMCARMECL